MAYFSDLLPLLMSQQQFAPPGGPVSRPLPKAQSNVTATPNPAVRLPPDYATTMANLANTFSEMPLRQAQAQQAGAQTQFLKTQIAAMPEQDAMIKSIIARAMGGGQPISINGQGAGNAPQQGAVGGGEMGSPAPGADTGAGGAPAVSSTTADDTLPPQARALLDTISGPESNGAYNVRWGGPNHSDVTFDDYSKHPNIMEPGPEGPSSAAGRYQIVHSTWEPLAAKYGFSDFQPKTQDQAAWHLASDTYNGSTGRDLLTDLQNGDTSRVAGALHGQWGTLKMGSYEKNLAKYENAPTQVAEADTGTATDAISPGAWSAMGGAGAPPPPAPAAPTFQIDPANAAPEGKPEAHLVNGPGGQRLIVGTMDELQRRYAQASVGATSAVARPTATPFTNAPPITGVGAPAPGPQLRPQVAQAPQAPPNAPMPLMPNTGDVRFGTGLDPLELGALGAFSEAHRLPNVAAPLMQAYLSSPAYKAALADAEARIRLQYAGPMAEAGKRVELQYAPQIAGAEALAKAPFTAVRPSSSFPTFTNGVRTGWDQAPAAPSPVTVFNSAGEGSPGYTQPGVGGAPPTLATVPNAPVTRLPPIVVSQQQEQGRNQANLGTTNPMGGPAPTGQPIPTAYGMLPPVSEQKLPGSADEAKAAIPEWRKQITEWTNAAAPGAQAEMRLVASWKALQAVQSGAWTTGKAEIIAGLKGAGINLPENITSIDPSKVQTVIHEAILSTLPMLKASTPRPAQSEFNRVSENIQNPDLQPETNQQIMAEGIALARLSQNLPNAFKASQWQDPQGFETSYLAHNNLTQSAEQIKKELGPLKGMAQSAHPPGGYDYNPATHAFTPRAP